MFFDTTSIYFDGEGSESLREYGCSEGHRPARKQIVVGVVLDEEDRPICCELLPGNSTDVTTLTSGIGPFEGACRRRETHPWLMGISSLERSATSGELVDEPGGRGCGWLWLGILPAGG